MFPFEMLSSLVRLIGWAKEIPHLNSAHPDLSFNEVKNRPLFNSALGIYEQDFILYENAVARQGVVNV